MALCVWGGSYLVRPSIEDKVYTIGWQQVPPFQMRGEDGLPTGVAADLVRDAASRRGVKLRWVWYPGSSEYALRNHEVDLWPLITITPERKRLTDLHITKPYLQHDHSLMVLASSRYTGLGDLSNASINYVNQPINRQHLSRILPQARLIPMESDKEALEGVCSGRADAVFMDEFSSGAVLLSGASCGSRPLRLVPLPMLRARLGVGSTREASVVADEIRREIDSSALDGELARILKSGGQYTPRNLEYVTALLSGQRRERMLTGAVTVFAILLAVVILAADRIRRQRNRIRAGREALRESERKLRLMANNLSEIVLAWNMDRKLVFVNPAMESLTGYRADELDEAATLPWVHPQDRERVIGCWEKAFDGGEFRDQEYRLVKRDGEIRWVLASWGPVWDESGKQAGVQGSERDITERKLAEQAKRESDRRFRELLETVQLVALMTDGAGRITFCNDHALALTGWSREEVVGKAFHELVDYGQALAHEGGEAEAGSLTERFFEGTILEKGGGRRYIQWSRTALRDSDGREAGFASLGEDVTELRAMRAKASRLESEARFRTTADTSPLMIWEAGPDGRCTFVNRGWLAFTGRTVEQEMGDGWTASLHPEDRDAAVAEFAASFEARRDYKFELRKRRADGEYRWVFASGVPRYGIEGDFAGYVGTCTDIDELKRMRDEQLARQKLENVGRLAAGIAHVFNNLLGGVVAQADLAALEIGEGQSPRERLDVIRNVGVRGSGIVRQLMVYGGQGSADTELVALSGLAADMMEILGAVAPKRVALRFEAGGDVPVVRANPDQLRQVIINLVTNAVDAIGDEAGEIVIRTAVAPEPGAYALLEVSDSGRGIPAEEQPRIFDPFFTTGSAGKGLGLAVVQGIVQGLGGSIRFESEAGRGTTFRILLPAAAGVSVKRAAVLPAVPADTNEGALVLVVEDEEPLRMPTVKVLRRNSLSVIEAGDGETALQLLQENAERIRVLLLDITLPPGTTSREVLAEALRLRPELKVIITSAYGQQKADESFAGMRYDEFIQKPYRLADLVALVQRFAGHAGKVTER